MRYSTSGRSALKMTHGGSRDDVIIHFVSLLNEIIEVTDAIVEGRSLSNGGLSPIRIIMRRVTS